MTVRRGQQRVALTVPVELEVDGEVLTALSQDLTPYGMFVRLLAPLPVGTRVELTVLPESERLRTPATVAHALSEAEARQLGRSPGVGLVFSDLDRGRAPNLVFAAAMTRLMEAAPREDVPARELHIVIADPSPRLLERLSTSFGQAGFSVAIASNGMEGLAACLRRVPDVVLAAREMPIIDGLHLLDELGRHPELAAVPVMIMSDQASDLIRLRAFQLGAMDFVPRPFTALEVILRARRLARLARRDAERVVLRGSLTALGLPPLLTMLEQERKTGILGLTRDEQSAWITFVEGRITRVRATDLEGDSIGVLMRVLDWGDGQFELVVGVDDEAPEIDLGVTHALLEHARRRDEAAR